MTPACGLFGAGLVLAPLAEVAQEAEERLYALTVFGGVVTDNNWHEIAGTPWDLEVTDGRFLGLGLSARLGEPIEGLDIEFEGQMVRHVAGQDNWELNVPLVAR